MVLLPCCVSCVLRDARLKTLTAPPWRSAPRDPPRRHCTRRFNEAELPFKSDVFAAPLPLHCHSSRCSFRCSSRRHASRAAAASLRCWALLLTAVLLTSPFF
ncbi:hypothetical protein O3P69_017048 [Scylla paramamosain]|uniref:Uncharacterized protein n=1 Tax=Scylla paramamosain TaxID=85552 RepID=A0AAW0TWX1_SCYPA